MNMRNKLIPFFIGGLFLLVLTLICTVFLLKNQGEKKLHAVPAYHTDFEEEELPNYSEITWDGGSYSYRENLITILCMGIDGRGKAVKSTDIGFGPRADSIYLAVLDPQKQELTLLNISRDSMAELMLYDSFGQKMGLYEMQLGAQYSVGDGLDSSCQLMAGAVSRMLHGIPIHGYAALYWQGIAALNDAAGPVTVDVPEDLALLAFLVFPQSGPTELTGEQAMVFVQGRDITVNGSNELRSQRQQAYFQELFVQAKEKLRKNPLSAFKMMNAVKDYLVTDLTADEILAAAFWMRNWDIHELTVRSLPGESVPTAFHDEFHLDENGTMQLLTDIFYEKEY